MGTVSDALSELVDMYPTLSELAGLTLPTGPAGEHLGGTSLVPVLKGVAKQVKNCTISQFPRCWQNNTEHSGGKPGDENNRTVSWESMSDCHWVDRDAIDYMGYKMRTEEWSVTAWSTWDGEALRPVWGSHCGDISHGRRRH
jgi:iduronate 2-sulfatase